MLSKLHAFFEQSRGITLANDKSATLRSRIMPTPLPEFLRISLQQADGKVAQAVVAPGDEVLRYQLLARATSEQGAAVHAPAAGKVVAIEELNALGSEDSVGLCIVIKVADEQQDAPLQELDDYRSSSPDTVLDILEKTGLRGGGGIGFPVATKIRLARKHQAHTVIVNAVECAPYQSADEALVREYASEVLNGAKILRHASEAQRCVIAFQHGKPEALQALRDALAKEADQHIELYLAPESYPAGSEEQLVEQITGKQIPSGSTAAELGVLVINAGAARNASLAVSKGIPCSSRIVTLAGNALRTPKNFDAPIGTPVRHLLALCGIDERNSFSTIIGDPLRGHYLYDHDCGIDINTRCIIAADSEEFAPPGEVFPCTRCGDCHTACVLHLQPDVLLRQFEAGNVPELQSAGLADCFECGACTFACPSNIDLASKLAQGKQYLEQSNDQSAVSRLWRERFEAHQQRLQRDKQKAKEPAEAVAVTPKAETFSRQKAQLDIAAAVARVRAKRKSSDLVKPQNSDATTDE
jgi:electron transport complex protein RnfC